MALYCRKDAVGDDVDVVEAEQFSPNVSIPEGIKPWTDIRPRDGSWGYIQGSFNTKVHVHVDDWIVRYEGAVTGAYSNSIFQEMYTPYPYKPLQGEAMNVEEKEVSLLDIIQDLQARVKKLEEENQKLRQDAHRGLTSYDYEEIYKEVMQRTARDLRLKTGARRA